MKKDELRKIFLAKRKALSTDDFEMNNQKISEQFFNHVQLVGIKYIHLYLPIENKQEPNTWLLVERIQQVRPEIRITIPRIRGEEMESVRFEGRTQLSKNQWGIPEPTRGDVIGPDKIDLIVVPLLAFDLRGHRIGYGKGYYDKYLKKCKPGCLKVGLSHFDPADPIEVGPYDVALSICVTPNKTYTF
ncbi:MAG: 5-formyltetrahydrofolate cyclo-ligase [Cyclobacteriaceae bacterium]|nr:5-formyltetrahydrofolate cyclo-ligase [Cyclobacteriaceae bacterium]